MSTVLHVTLLALLAPVLLLVVGTSLNLLFGALRLPVSEPLVMLLSLLLLVLAGVRTLPSRRGASGPWGGAALPWVWGVGVLGMTVFLAAMSTDAGSSGAVGVILVVGGVVAGLPLAVRALGRGRQERGRGPEGDAG